MHWYIHIIKDLPCLPQGTRRWAWERRPDKTHPLPEAHHLLRHPGTKHKGTVVGYFWQSLKMMDNIQTKNYVEIMFSVLILLTMLNFWFSFKLKSFNMILLFTDSIYIYMHIIAYE